MANLQNQRPATEETPLSGKGDSISQITTVLFWASLMISCSATLINFNKYLVSSGVFAFPLHLVLMHTLSGSFFALILYKLMPSMFPALSDTQSKVVLDRNLMVNKVLPVTLAFAGSLVLSNMAYLHLSLAFLQMLKQMNVVLVYVGSVAIGLEQLVGKRLALLAFIVLGTMLNIHGEMNFNLIGFLIQVSSQLCEVTKLLLQEIMLSSAGIRLDAMSYVLIVMPCCFIVLLSLLLGLTGLSHIYGPELMGKDFAIPGMSDFANAAPLLLLNALVAFALNIIIAQFIKHTSAVALPLTNLVKDNLIVVVAVAVLGETVSGLQCLGFGMQMAGVFQWSLLKKFPQQFEEHGLLRGTYTVLFSKPEEKKNANV